MAEIKVRVGNSRVPIEVEERGSRLFLHFGYNPQLIKEVKGLAGAKWHPEEKEWSITKNQRNDFQLRWMQWAALDANQRQLVDNPFHRYDEDVTGSWETTRSLYQHQKDAALHVAQRKYGILASEMGCGKSLVAIDVAEKVKPANAWYVGPRAGVKAFSRELVKWGCTVQFKMMTYEGLIKVLKDWDGTNVPQYVVFDESSRIKTASAQRSQAAKYLADAVREAWGDEGYIVLMSGTPAPKSPDDWWHQCEVACPGFIKEKNSNDLRARLSLTEERTSISGQTYRHLITWLDDETKCALCGAHKDVHPDDHPFKPSVNEVSKLYRRLNGLVLVQFKRDCLDLPEKTHEIIRLTPTPEILRAAKLVEAKATRAIEALTCLRELSDGFQYAFEEVGNEPCPSCKGEGSKLSECPGEGVITCDYCSGEGTVPRYTRIVEELETPKDQIFLDELDAHLDGGRLVVWGGFTGTLDRLVKMAHQNGWATLRVDGRGYAGESEKGEVIDSDVLLDAMDLSNPKYQELLDIYPRVCFIGNPQAGGMALTLTASPTALFYSNSFSGEARIQAEDRIHRVGMDKNRGCIIKDIVMLPTDQLVLDNLLKKKRLQSLTLGEIFDGNRE